MAKRDLSPPPASTPPVAAPFCVVRAPVLPFDAWLALTEGLEAPRADRERLEAALAVDRKRFEERLRALVDRPEIREAIYLASPPLVEAIEAWRKAPATERGQKVERALLRYVSRMVGRATPFGLFSGCAVGTVGDGATQLGLAGHDQQRRHTRLGVDYLFGLCALLQRDPALRARLRYRPSSSLYRVADSVRYAEAKVGASGERRYTLAAIELTPHLEAALAAAHDGSTIAEIAARVADAADATLEEAQEFVEELITEQVLVSELSPVVTGDEPIHRIIELLEGHPARAPLVAVRDALAKLDGEPIGVELDRYRDIADALRELPIDPDPARLLQVDLRVQGRGLHVGREHLEEITRSVDVLRRIADVDDRLRSFCEAFVQRYESAEVPLAEALDEETGIGFERSDAPSAENAPLLEGLPFPGRGEPTSPWRRREQWYLGVALDAARGTREIRLTEDDLRALSVAPKPLPASFYVIAELHRPRADASAPLVNLPFGLGPSAGNILGRFCHGDERLHRLLRDHLAAEEASRPEVAFAEIVHMPEARVGNVILRPVLREWEIPYLGTSGATADHQLPLDDLTVTVWNGRILLRSRRLGREVVPRLSSAHNYSSPRSPGVYRFLCALQNQGVTSVLEWSWGPVASAPFLPRVVHSRTILSRACWQLGKKKLTTLIEARGAAQYRAARALQESLGLPRFMTVDEGDHRMLVDFDHAQSIAALAHLAGKRDGLLLSEMMPEPDAFALEGPGGRYVHEVVIPFLGAPARTPARAVPASSGPTIMRRLPPGSDWLYAKIYGGPAVLDDVLARVVAPVVRGAIESGAVSHWFFIRYSDPDPHLRLRFCGAPERLQAELQPALWRAAHALFDGGRVWRLQLDTYHREVERYGGSEGMLVCERLFAADSDAALSIVERLEGADGADARWRLALLACDRLLDDLGFDLPGKIAIMEDLAAGYARELAVDTDFERQLGNRFRRERAALEELLAGLTDPEHELAPGIAILAARAARQRTLGAALRELEGRGALTTPLPAIAQALLHMCCNRLLRGAARAQELVLYDFLARLYDGQQSRARRRRDP